MRKRGKVILFGVCVVLAVIAMVALKRETEPSYGGRPLSYWVESLSSEPTGAAEAAQPTPEERTAATNAIAHIGVAALPFLVKWIQYEPSAPSKIISLLDKLPYDSGKDLAARLAQPRARALRLADGACWAFPSLEKRATPALDKLTRLINNTNAPVTATRAFYFLACLGTNALPALTAVIQNPRHASRKEAVLAINLIDKIDRMEPSQIPIPAIIECLGATNDRPLRFTAVMVLGELKASPELCIPAIIPFLKSPDIRIRVLSAGALGKFGPLATNAVPALTNALADSDSEVRDSAARALHAIDPAIYTNSPPARIFQ